MPAADRKTPGPSEPLPEPAARARFLTPFLALRTASVVFWVCLVVYTLDGAAYFGTLNVLSLYLGKTLHFAMNCSCCGPRSR